MEIQNTTIITLGELTSATMKPLEKSNKTTIICFIIIALCSAFMIATGDTVLGIIFLCIGIFFPVFTYFMKRAFMKRMQRANSNMSEGIYYEYQFRDEDFTVSTVAGSNTSINNLRYADLFRIQVVDDLIFLYINQANAYVVKDAGFHTPDDKDAFYRLVREKYASIMVEPRKK